MVTARVYFNDKLEREPGRNADDTHDLKVDHVVRRFHLPEVIA